MRPAPPSRPQARCETRPVTVAADAETVNLPATVAEDVRHARPRSRGCEASRGLPRVAASDGNHTARSTHRRARRSDISGTPWYVPAVRSVPWSSACLLHNERIAQQVVDVGCAEPGDQVVSRSRVVDCVAAEDHVA